jgi:hypothetical protein
VFCGGGRQGDAARCRDGRCDGEIVYNFIYNL